MDAVTRRLVRKEKVAARKDRAQARTERKAAEATEQTLAKELHTAKATAVKEVNEAARAAVKRISFELWQNEGRTRGVGRKRVTLLPIPGARGGCREWCDNQSEDHRVVWLGSDGQIYRFGHRGAHHVARLIERKTPEDIRALLPKLKAMK